MTPVPPSQPSARQGSASPGAPDRRPLALAVLYLLAGAAAFVLFAVYVLADGLKVDFFNNPYKSDRHNGRIKVEYWDLWTGFEGEAMQRVVDRFNASQDRIWVVKQTISDLNQRFLVSVAGNNAPDVASIFQTSVPAFAEKGALLRLDTLAAEKGIVRDQYLPVFWRIGHWRDHLYALPTVASTLALFYNKRLFREAGLDPDKPPQTLAELDAMAKKLTKRDAKGKLKVVGFSPTEPGWWPQTWAFWFGGDIWDGKEAITVNSDAYVRALEWVQGFVREYGVDDIQNFQSGFGNFFSSPQNAFLSGLVAMEIQGVWMPNFISKYNPELEYGVAPFPSETPGKLVSLVESNILVIPSNARHPKEAFEFLAFVQRPEVLEQLCLDQRAFPPLSHVSDDFWKRHPNPYIHLFYELAQSPDSRTYPQLSIWNEMNDEITATFSEVSLLRSKPRPALDALETKLNALWSDELAVIRLREKTHRDQPVD